MNTTSKLVDRLRTMADGVAKEVARKRGPRQENTPKRQREGMSARIDAAHLERVQRCLCKLADASEAGRDVGVLGTFKWTKANLLKMLRTHTESQGYYHVSDTGRYCDTSAVAVALQRFLECEKSAAEQAADLDRARLEKVQSLECSVKFSDIPGFYPTPSAVIDRVIALADIKPGHSVLEPSAGKGDMLVRANTAAAALIDLRSRSVAVEVNHKLCEIIQTRLPGQDVRCDDFLALNDLGQFDRVVMNPPFENGQDCDHVQHAYRMLKPGGRLVAVVSTSWLFRQQRKYSDFREWVYEVGGSLEVLPSGAFNGSDAFRQTGTAAQLLMIDKS